jgi:hypothetical protein
MSEKEPEQVYPVKTLHDFLSEINREWQRFKRGTLASLFFLSIMLATFVPLFVRAVRYEWDLIMYVFLIGLAAFLIYSIRVMISQYRFFRKWDHRREQLVNLEEKLMSEKLSDASQSG